MSALAVRVAHPAAVAAPSSAGAPTAAPGDAGFAALLGKMAHPKPSGAASLSDGAAKSKTEAQPADGAPLADATTSALSALQSLEAALAGFGPLAPPTRVSSPLAAGGAQTAAANATGNAATLNSALATVAGALDGSGAGGAWDGSGKTPLKALLQADPTLGLSDFQMKTHLAAAGATPARAGAAALGIDSAWHPLGAATLANAPNSDVRATPVKTGAMDAPPLPPVPSTLAAAPAAGPEAPSAAILDTFAPGLAAAAPAPLAAAPPPSSRAAVQMRASTHGSAARSSHSAAPSPIAFASTGSAVTASAGSAGVGPRKDGAANETVAAAAATSAASTDAPATPMQTLPLAQLPAFIAEQAGALTADAAAAANTTASAAPATQAKAAQAVKELNIALDPADLGQMTLKLRLAGGKLSVTIDVANPQTLAAIEGDRSLIATRILSGDQTLEDLVIQRQSPAASTSETVSAHASSSDKDSSSESENPSDNSGSRPGASPRRGGGGAFGDLLV